MYKVFLKVTFLNLIAAPLFFDLAKALGGDLINKSTGGIHLSIEPDADPISPEIFSDTLNSIGSGSIYIWLPDDDDSLFVSFRRGIENVLTCYTDGFTAPEKAHICSSIVKALISDQKKLDTVMEIKIFDDEID